MKEKIINEHLVAQIYFVAYSREEQSPLMQCGIMHKKGS